MAVSVVSSWESGLGPVGISYVLASDWICFRTSFPSLGNYPSLQNHSLGRNLGKCNQTCEQTNGIISFVLMRNNLLVADLSYGWWIESNWHFQFLSCRFYSVPCWERKPNGQPFFLEWFIKAQFWVKKLCLYCFILYLRRFQSIHYGVALIALNFHVPVDFRLNVLFPFILSILHPFWVGKSWLPFVM